nr:hypothetical protein [Tanacetum cinerariifolium]
MGPIRGSKKKRKIDIENVLVCGSFEEGCADWWEHFCKQIAGSVSPSKSPDQFKSIFKVSRKTFNYICSLVNEPMMAKATSFAFVNGVANYFGTSHITVSHVTWRFVEAIEERGLHHLQWPSTDYEFTQIKSKFENVRGLPNCCGAIDTTHIMMLLAVTDKNNDAWLDRMHNHSMILQVIVDPDMRFRDVVTGWPGTLDDASVLRKSSLFDRSEKGERLNGKKLKLTEGIELQEYIVGDSSFPLLPWLITPYQGRELPETKSEFNKRHFATRLVAQRALARLKDIWRMIHGVMWRPDKNRLPRVILACCILHNIVIDTEDDVLDELTLTHQHDPGYRSELKKCILHSGMLKDSNLRWPPRVTLGRLLPHARGLGFKPRRGGFPSGAKKEWGLSPKAKVRVLHTAQLDVTGKRRGQSMSVEDAGVISSALFSLQKFSNDESFLHQFKGPHQQKNNDSSCTDGGDRRDSKSEEPLSCIDGGRLHFVVQCITFPCENFVLALELERDCNIDNVSALRQLALKDEYGFVIHLGSRLH